jgi:hypothetical protein
MLYWALISWSLELRVSNSKLKWLKSKSLKSCDCQEPPKMTRSLSYRDQTVNSACLYKLLTVAESPCRWPCMDWPNRSALALIYFDLLPRSIATLLIKRHRSTSNISDHGRRWISYTCYHPSVTMKLAGFREEFSIVSGDFAIAYAVFGFSLIVSFTCIRHVYRIRQRRRAIYERPMFQMEQSPGTRTV